MKKIINLLIAIVLLLLAFLLLRHYKNMHDPSFACEELLKTESVYLFQEQSVPIKMFGGLPVVQVSVNNSPGLPFVLATGMGICVFDEELARQLKLAPPKVSVTNDGKELLLGEIGLLQIGAAKVPNVPVLINNLDWTQEHFGKFVAGFIGYGFLQHFETVFDFPDSMLTLSPTDSLPDTIQNSDSLIVLPFANVTERQRHVFVNARVNEKEVPLEIDTMIRDGLYLAGTPDRYQPGVFFGDKNETTRVARSHTIQRGNVSRLKLGDFQLNDIGTHFSCIVSPQRSFSDANVLGMGVLKQFKMTLNYKKRQLILEKR